MSRITPINEKKAKNTSFDNNTQHEPDVERPQKTSKDLKSIQTNPNKKNKNILKAASVQENIEIDEHFLDELLQNKNS